MGIDKNLLLHSLRIRKGILSVNENESECQAKVEMSYSYQSRNVLFG